MPLWADGRDQANRPESRGTRVMRDEGDAPAGHQLLHALALGAGVVIAITLQQVDGAHTPRPAPRAITRVWRTSTAGVEKIHNLSSLK